MPRPRIAVFIALALIVAVTALGSDKPAVAQPAPEAATEVAPAQTGLQIAIDPVTGKFRAPTPEEARVLAAGLRTMLNDSSEGLTGVRLANGAEMLPLEDRFLNVFIGIMQPEGDLQTECLTNADQAAAVVTAAVKESKPAGGKKE